MAQHISRRDLKRDEVRETFTHGAEAVALHKTGVALAIVAVLVVLAAVLGWRYYAAHQTTAASAALGDALTVYNARIRAAGEAAEPNEVTYVDEKNKWQDAARKFDDIVAKYGRTRPGQQAEYYAAICYENLGNYAQAEKDLKSVEDAGDADLAPLARFQHAELYNRMGKPTDAANLYHQLLTTSSVLVPKPLVMLGLANVYAKSNPLEAAKMLNQIKTDYPGTAAADEADKLLETSAAAPKT